MSEGDGSCERPASRYEAWRALVRTYCGRYSPEGAELSTFAGSISPRRTCGFTAIDVSCNVDRVDRTQRDVRLDGSDDYKIVFQGAGESTLVHNDRVVKLTTGDIALVDISRPATYAFGNRPCRWLALIVPRRSLISHLGLEPQGGLTWHNESRADRLLFRLAVDSMHEGDSSGASADPYLHLAAYNLLGAMLAVSDQSQVSSSRTERLFTRICDIIKGRFTDPDISSGDIAADAGISVRYLQKLFTERGTSCSRFVQSLRLDHAARLLHRRALTGTNQPLSEIAYACGFRDYNHFYRTFRLRFGHPPSAVDCSLSTSGQITHPGHRETPR